MGANNVIQILNRLCFYFRRNSTILVLKSYQRGGTPNRSFQMRETQHNNDHHDSAPIPSIFTRG